MDLITLYPFISVPTGIEVCFSRNGGRIEQRRFPAGTSREAILAELQGCPLPAVNPAAIAAAQEEEKRKLRAAAAQAGNTTAEEELKQNDAAQENKINELNLMRSALKEAGVKGYQLWKEETLRRKYAELKAIKAEKK